MYNNNKISKAVRLAIALGAASAMAFSATAAAQAAEEQTAQQTAVDLKEVEKAESAPERISVTGSRLRRAEFSNASPIQVISGDISREMGLMDTASMLQSSNQASGLQIDNSFGGFVLDNGPGASTIAFRGLGADRTLVLINGRRMAPAGVGGAPSSPDLNLIPGVMVQRIENLFDGASTVYGSDAIAGVSNVILKKDVEGFEFAASYRQPKGVGGQEKVVSAMWGTTTDNGFITIGAELLDQQRQTNAGFAFNNGCDNRIYEAEDGRIIKRSSGYGPAPQGDVETCDVFPLTNRIQLNDGFFGSLYATPGSSNVGIPGFSENSLPLSLAGRFPGWVGADSNYDGINDFTMIDANGDGFNDVDLTDPFYAYQKTDTYRNGDHIAGLERLSVMLNGEYNLQDANDTVVYFEGLYARRETEVNSGGGGQFFQWVEADNPFNPCGEYSDINCRAAYGATQAAMAVRPILNIRGDRDFTDVSVEQYRAVVGVTASLPGLESMGLNNWVYDVYASHSASTGKDRRQGISQERLDYSLNTSRIIGEGDDAYVVCGTGNDGCVPVNLFGANLYQLGGGQFTDAEAAYLFVDRSMNTRVAQTIVNGYVTGDLFTLPWNDEAVPLVVGAEYRRDRISTEANDITTQGGLHNYFSDGGADGSRSLKEFFAEMELPLLKGAKFAEELTVTAAIRSSNESFYDAATTHSLKAVYRPVDWLTLRATKGTSFRAPNLRERFLNGTTGFNTITDPCVVPEAARIVDPNNPQGAAGYDATKDTRTDAVKTACTAAGLDPTKLGISGSGSLNFLPGTSTEIVTGGTTELSEETSTAKTFGFILDQKFSDDFELTFSYTRFDIEITNSIVEPSAPYSVSQCYGADVNPAFCNRITRDPVTNRITMIDSSFINVGLETSKGDDYNLFYKQDFVVAEKNLTVSLDLQATKMREAVTDILGTVDDNVGEAAFPEWRGMALLTTRYDDFRLSWKARYISGGQLDDQGTFTANTVACTGLTNSAGEPLKCRPLSYTEDYYVHDVSFGYSFDNFEISAGLRNVFNERPPLADPSGVFSNNNIPLGVGYEAPRSAFVNFSMKL